MQAAGAARHGILKLHEVVKHVCRVVNARETIKSWGTVIRNQYNVDNLALTIEVHLHPDLKPVLDIVTSQGAQIVNLYRQQVPACQPYACRAYACCQPYIQIRT